MPVLSRTARRAQSALANAAKAKAPEPEIERLRTAFAVARAQDALNAIPGAPSSEQRARLHEAVDALRKTQGGGAR